VSHPEVERTGICADCGAAVEWVPLSMGGWGRPIENPGIGSRAWDMTCRTVYADDGRILSSDRHYVAGETQRHFRAPEVEGS